MSRPADGPPKRAWRGRAALGLTVVIWSTPPLFQYYLAADFDPWSQNFYRYGVGFLTVLPFMVVQWRSRPLRLTAGEWTGCFAAAVPNVLHQVAQTVAVVLIMPGLYALLGRFSVLLTALMAVVVFADERWILRNRRFQGGLVLGLAGVGGVIWQGSPLPAVSDHAEWIGVGLAFAATFGWASYGILVKKFTGRIGPTTGFVIISFFTTLLLLPLTLAFGDLGAPWRAQGSSNLVLVISAAFSIGLGHWLYYVGLRDLGAASSQAALLLCPLGTVLLSAWWFAEPFTWWQGAAGLVLLGGAYLSLTARPEGTVEPD